MTFPIPEFLYESIFDDTFDGLAYCQMIFDREGHPVDFVYLRVNEGFESLSGLHDVVGKKNTEMIRGIHVSNPELFEMYGRVSLTHHPERLETYIAPLARWFSVSVHSPQKTFFVALFDDITERKRIEKDLENARIAAGNVLEDLQIEGGYLAEAKAKDEAMLASIGDGIIMVDPNGKIILMNQMAQDMLGWKMGEVAGELLFGKVPLEDEKNRLVSVSTHPMALALATSETKITHGIYYYIRKDKTKFPAASTVAPVILREKIIGAIDVFRDSTREKEIDKAKSEFVSLASHQLRTPTTAIKWYSEMLLAGEAGAFSEDQKRYVQEIYHGNQRMIDLVNTLLSISRIELGTFTMQMEATDNALIIDDILRELRAPIEEKGLAVEKKYADGAVLFESDPKLVRIILQNLLSNAVFYTPAKGNISLARTETAAGAHIEIGDSGCGIPLAAQPKIYTKFFRADNARAIKPDGTGLGLYITKSIVEALGGTISFQSKENKGTTFSVDIPNRGAAKNIE